MRGSARTVCDAPRRPLPSAASVSAAALRVAPVVAQRFDDRRQHQPLDVGARRVVRAECGVRRGRARVRARCRRSPARLSPVALSQRRAAFRSVRDQAADVSGSLNSLPLKRGTSLRGWRRKSRRRPWRATTRRPACASPRRAGRHISQQNENCSVGSSPTSSANMVNRQRMRNRATGFRAMAGLLPGPRANSASCAAISRVTRADCARGIERERIVPDARNRSRIASSRRSSSAMRYELRGSGNGV